MRDKNESYTAQNISQLSLLRHDLLNSIQLYNYNTKYNETFFIFTVFTIRSLTAQLVCILCRNTLCLVYQNT